MEKKSLAWFAVALSLIACSKQDDKGKSADSNSPPAPTVAAPAPAAPVAVEPVAVKAPEPVVPVAPANPQMAIVTPSTPPPAVPAAPVVPAPTAVQSTKEVAISDLSSDQVTGGLKEALGKGLQAAVAQLGKPGGFLSDPSVKIPMPDKLQSVESTLRTVGQGALADQFVTTMNQAAEQAVPAAAGVFADSLKSMTVADATKILTGPDDAATQYFRTATQADLSQKFLPIVKKATASCGATAAYKQIMDRAKVVSPFFNTPSMDLDSYVTGKAMDGLFKIVAEQEKQIRLNPVARTSDLLKSVFGALKK